MNASVYAKPVLPRIFFRPALATVLLHSLLLFFLTANWPSAERETVRVKPAPKSINARLVDVSELQAQPKPKPKPVAPQPKPQPKPKPVVKPEPKVVKPKPKPQAKAKPKRAETPKPKPVEKPQPITTDELAAIARAELSDSLAREEATQTASGDELAASFAALIQRTVVNYWSRPPSARNGMEALLAIQLIPTGEVVNVTILQSSGNSAFDRSAVNAVEKAGSFPELQQLPSREFERSFRRFRLLFRPEDLRY